jgi:hypothetical protein
MAAGPLLLLNSIDAMRRGGQGGKMDCNVLLLVVWQNADPDVRTDMETFLNQVVPEVSSGQLPLGCCCCCCCCLFVVVLWCTVSQACKAGFRV